MKKISLFVLALLAMVSFVYTAEAVWHDDLDTLDGWYDNKTDKSFRAVILKSKEIGTADVVQRGDGNWGKVAFVVTNCDLDKYNIMRVKIKSVDKNADYKVLAVSQDWAESYVLLDRGAGKGIKQANIAEVTGWKGKKTFNIVVVVEGKDKKVTLDWVEVSEANAETANSEVN